jgi:hypothetical protein
VARLSFALRVCAEPGVDAIRSLKAWLKRGLREYGLRCTEIQQVSNTENATMAINLNEADNQDRSIMPAGPYWVKARIRPGQAGDDGLLRLAKNQYSLMLDLQLTVIDNDEWRGKQVFDLVTCDLLEYEQSKDPLATPPLKGTNLANLQTSVRMGRSKLKAMLNSAFGLLPNDDSEGAQAKRVIEDFSAFDGLCFMAQIEVQPARDSFKERNVVDFIIEPGDPAYRPRGSNSKQMVTAPKPGPRSSLASELNDELPEF